MSDIKADDIRIGDVTGAEYRVIAIHGDYAWVALGDSYQPSTETLQFLYSRTSPKVDFFEEGKRYKHSIYPTQISIQEIRQCPSGPFALAVQLNDNLSGSAGDLRVFSKMSWEVGLWDEI